MSATPISAAEQERQARIKEAAERVLRAYAAVEASEDGRLMLEDIDRCAFVSSSTLATGATVDIHRAMVNEGARTLALLIRDKARRGREIGKAPVQTKAVSATAGDK